jgi:hypothetical protein
MIGVDINGDTSTIGYDIPLLYIYTRVVSDAFQAEWIAAR